MYVQSFCFIAKLNLLFFVVFVNVAVVVAYVKLPNKAQSTYPFLLQNRNFSPSVWPPVHTNPARTVSIPNSETKLCNFNTTRAFPSLYMEVPPGSLCTHTPRLIFLRGGGVCIQYRLLRGGGGGAMVRLVNFVPESRLMYKNIKTLPETGINDSFEEMEPEFSFGIFCPEEEDYLSKCIFR